MQLVVQYLTETAQKYIDLYSRRNGSNTENSNTSIKINKTKATTKKYNHSVTAKTSARNAGNDSVPSMRSIELLHSLAQILIPQISHRSHRYY